MRVWGLNHPSNRILGHLVCVCVEKPVELLMCHAVHTGKTREHSALCFPHIVGAQLQLFSFVGKRPFHSHWNLKTQPHPFSSQKPQTGHPNPNPQFLFFIRAAVCWFCVTLENALLSCLTCWLAWRWSGYFNFPHM